MWAVFRWAIIFLLIPIPSWSHEVIDPMVLTRVAKYKSFLLRNICFNLGCDKVDKGFAQIHQESRWKSTAQSKYASGLAQFTPDTAKWINQVYARDLRELCSDDKNGCPLDPKWALRAMTLYMRQLYRSYPWAATEDDRFAIALAAYNGGAGWIPRERKKANLEGFDSNRWFGGIEITCLRAKQFCDENREYPRIIMLKFAPLYRHWLNGG